MNDRMKYPKLAAKGFCMGAADVVPGVSGGTMAFILGIYEELIDAIRSIDLNVIKLILTFRIKEALDKVPWRFLLSVGAGILTAIFTLAKLISYLLHNHPVFIWSFFFGLVLASIISVKKRIDRWTPLLVVAAAAGAAGAYFLVGLVPMETPSALWFIFLSGAVAICAMILPGISGSFILVLLGKYHHILEAVNNRDFFTLIVFSLGAACGLFFFSRFLSWLLNRHHNITIAVLCGLMLGSLRKVWPWKAGGINIMPHDFSLEVIYAAALAFLGIISVLLIDKLAEK